jgi:hypothetical protein
VAAESLVFPRLRQLEASLRVFVPTLLSLLREAEAAASHAKCMLDNTTQSVFQEVQLHDEPPPLSLALT